MALRPSPSGVTGTLGAFNFIRRVAFPSTPSVVSIFATLVFLPTLTFLPSVGLNILSIVSLTTVAIIVPVVFGELLDAHIILGDEPVLDFRRLMGMELLSWCPMVFLLPLSALLGLALSGMVVWDDVFFLTLAASMPIRSLAVFAISSVPFWRKTVAVALVPATILAGYTFVLSSLSVSLVQTVITGLAVVVSGLALSIVSVALVVRQIDNGGSPTIGDSPMALFRAFLQHWLKKEPTALEDRLSALGSTRNIETSILAFYNKHGRPKGCIVVSSFHPGPYRDLGSGGLPSRIKSVLESSIGAVTLVPHSISNHEHNIISSIDIDKLLRQIQELYPKGAGSNTHASRFIREEFEGAKASAQAIGELVIVTATLAPEDMEDLPEHVLKSIQTVATERGMKPLVVDAHNSLSGQTSITPDQARRLVQAATMALESVSHLPKRPFQVGAATDPLVEFTLEDGIGPGGLSAMVLKVESQLAAYVTIDGNNMQSGVRQRILDALRETGIDDAEVTTTDTHLVTGLVRSSLGYHPVGEGIDNQLLIKKVRQTVQRAEADMEEGGASISSFNSDLRVLGSATFRSITSFVSTVAARIGRFFLGLELVSFLLAAILLLVL